jgi:hypothetical protein
MRRPVPRSGDVARGRGIASPLRRLDSRGCHPGTTCRRAKSTFPVNDRKFTGIFQPQVERPNPRADRLFASCHLARSAVVHKAAVTPSPLHASTKPGAVIRPGFDSRRGASRYGNNQAVYSLLRYGVPVKIEAGKLDDLAQACRRCDSEWHCTLVFDRGGDYPQRMGL